MSGKPGCGATQRAPKLAKATYDAIEKAIEDHGEMTAYELVERTGLSRSTIKMALERLRKLGIVRMLGKKPDATRTGIKPRLYGLGSEKESAAEVDEDDFDSPFKRPPTLVVVHRHPQDVAFFGEYERRQAA
jgi:DNA-binding transcriptional ArsR family regulator